MHRFLLGCLLTSFAGSALAATSDIDAALARVGQLEEASDFAGIAILLRPFSDSGNAQVEYYLAYAQMNLAINGKGPLDIRPGDLQPAIDFAERAAKHGSKEAWNLLYMIHGNGFGVPVDAAKSIGYLKRGVEAGDLGAKLNYAIQLYQGSLLVKRDVDAACPLFDELAEQKALLPFVSYYEGVIRFRGQCGKAGDRTAGMALIRTSAEHGVRDAERDMGKNYEFGWTVAVDNGQALDWYEKAAGHGDPEAEWRLGMTYVNGGLGQKQDFGKARRCFEGAAASGYPKALTDLGSMFAAGEGVPKDFARARGLYEQAAEAGDPRALRELAVMHAQGEGMTVDLVSARVLYLKALQAGWSEEAQLKNLIESKMTPDQLEESKRQFEQFRGKPGL